MTESNAEWGLRRAMEFIRSPAKTRQKYWAMDVKSGQMEETFIKEQYRWLLKRLKPNTTLLDIGASMGDASIYFASSPNVKKVISFEPVPKTYDLAKRMLETNRYKEKIQFNNAAITNTDGVIYSDEWGGWAGKGWALSKVNGKGRWKISQHTLDHIIKGINGHIAIKCDVEGDEKIIFPDADLSKVYAIILEYHWGCHDEVAKVLQGKGFKIKDIGPTDKNRCGIMGAWRQAK